MIADFRLKVAAMKRKLIATLCLLNMLPLLAQELQIQSFDNNGQLVFNEIENATNYSVKQAVAPYGPWTNFTGEAAALNSISPSGSGMITSTVPPTGSACFYRVEALEGMPAPAGMVRIPGGTNSGIDPESGVYSLTVSTFYMDKYLVTKEKWDVVYNWAITNGYSFDRAGQSKGVNHPVHSQNWYDCVKWCNARSEKEGRPTVYHVNGNVYRTGQANNVTQTAVAGYRLPTDTEWEYAGRGGLSGKRFPWGDTITHNQANYNSYEAYKNFDISTTRGYHPTYATGGLPYTSPVGSFAPNGYGLYDMTGNLHEWCFDWYPNYEGLYRICRTGSWATHAIVCRVGCRYMYAPYPGDYYIGFRTVLSPAE